MNDPDYRAKYDIKTQRPIEDDWKAENGVTPPTKALVISTSTYSSHDYRQMERSRQLFLLLENHGVLRQVARFVRHEKGIKEMEFYRQLDDDTHAEPQRWPTILFTLDSIRYVMVPPGSWRFFIDEIRDYLITKLDVASDSALETVLQVQHALLPARDRMFPLTLDLAHDYTRWHQEMLKSKQIGWDEDWTPGVQPLRSFPPATLVIKDSQQLTSAGMGSPMGADQDVDWEFDSPVGRALTYRRTAELV